MLGHVALFGIVHETDEGTAAHLYQLLMAGQVPVIGYFVLRYVPEQSGTSLLGRDRADRRRGDGLRRPLLDGVAVEQPATPAPAPVSTGSPAASHAAIPPAISLT